MGMTPRRKIAVAPVVMVLLVCGGDSPTPSAAAGHSGLEIAQLRIAEVPNAIRGTLRDDPASSLPLTSSARNELTTLYEADGYRPLWVDGSGHPTSDARATVALLTGAANEGLDPVDYRPSVLAVSGAPPAVVKALEARQQKQVFLRGREAADARREAGEVVPVGHLAPSAAVALDGLSKKSRYVSRVMRTVAGLPGRPTGRPGTPLTR